MELKILSFSFRWCTFNSSFNLSLSSWSFFFNNWGVLNDGRRENLCRWFLNSQYFLEFKTFLFRNFLKTLQFLPKDLYFMGKLFPNIEFSLLGWFHRFNSFRYFFLLYFPIFSSFLNRWINFDFFFLLLNFNYLIFNRFYRT